MIEIDVDNIKISNNNLIIYEDIERHYNIISSLKGGKSGDKVYLVKDKTSIKTSKTRQSEKTNTKLVIKILKSKQEINQYINVIKIFDKLNPYPILHNYGMIIKNKKYYMIMEFINAIDLQQYINANKCQYNKETHNIMMQLFHIITKLNSNELIHCDLHINNLFLVKTKKPITLDFKHINSDYKFKQGNYAIKIIDFGETKKGKCRLTRKTSKIIERQRTLCKSKKKSNNLNELKTIILDRLFTKKSNVDINFFITILSIFNYDNTPIDTKYLYNLNNQTILEKTYIRKILKYLTNYSKNIKK